MHVRKATASDFPAILALIRLFPDKLLQNHLPQAEEFFVALEDERIVGCCALEIYSKRLAEIRSLAVLSEFQGRGIATALVQACLTEATEKNIYEILTIAGTVAFFEKQGFSTFNNERFALFKVLGK